MTTNSSFKDRNVAPHLALIAVQIMFGSWAIFAKIVLQSMSSASLVDFRICSAAIIFTILQRKLSELQKLPKRVIAWLVLSSLLGIVINQLLSWLAVIYIVLVPTVIAYYLNAWALMRVAPSVVAIYIYMQPLLAFGLAPVVLGESWNSRTILACALIFAGVAVVTIHNRSRSGLLWGQGQSKD